MRRVWLVLEATFCIVAIGLVAVFLAYAWPSDPQKPKDAWDVLTAVGTLAAAIVALGIAVFQNSRESRDAISRGRIAIALMKGRTMEMHQRALQLAFTLNSELAGEFDQLALDRIERTLEPALAIEIWTSDEILPLAALPDDCAEQLAVAVGLFRDVVLAVKNTMPFMRSGHTFGGQLAFGLGEQVEKSVQALESAIDTMLRLQR